MSGPQTIDLSVKDQAVAWMTRLNSGQCSGAERYAFRKWLDEDPSHRLEYQQAREYWDSLGALKSGLSPELGEARDFHAGARHRRFALAASVLVFIAAAAMFWLRTPAEIPVVAYETSKGEQKSVVLTDGTRVDLNTETRLRVSFTPDSRTVELENGEAYFNIAPDEERPFEVIAGEGRIRDIGTAFCVQRESDRVSLVVAEGLVRVDTGAFASPVSITAGYTLSYDGAGRLLDSQAVDTEAHIAWRTGRIVFRGASIDELTRQIMRYHNVTILVDHAGLDDLQVSGNFKISDLDGLLSALTIMLPVEVTRPDTNSIKLTAKKSA